VTSLNVEIRETATNLKDYIEKCDRLELLLVEKSASLHKANSDLNNKNDRLEVVLREFDSLKDANKSLKESCRVLELENTDLMSSERNLKLQLAGLGLVSAVEVGGPCGVGVVDEVEVAINVVENLVDITREELEKDDEDEEIKLETTRYCS
jgi:chromosome segregation ATPase